MAASEDGHRLRGGRGGFGEFLTWLRTVKSGSRPFAALREHVGDVLLGLFDVIGAGSLDQD